MFSNLTVALILSLGAGAWIYAKLMRSSGNNAKSALTGAAISAAILCILTLIVLGALFKS